VRLGVVILSDRPWAELAGRWRHVEELGFDAAWTFDHVTWFGKPHGAWYAAVPTLAAAASATSSIRLGTLVATPNYRHPVPFASEMVSLDDLTGGRLVLGLGAGGGGVDAALLGHEPWPRRERTERFEEFVTMLDLLLRQPVTTHRGRYYSANDARLEAGCVQRPRVPFAVAATGPRGIRLAARHAQTWVTAGASGRLGAIPEQVARLEDACAAIGRDPGQVARLVTLFERIAEPDALGELVVRCAEMGLTDLAIHDPRSHGPFQGDPELLDRIASELLPKLPA
jgi:alkanesulfonate monooxygenase SsuD/methylene tetrahydromethanopterin reductase-like flavin-dependent oxidoreductase (luciferase family)